MKIVFKRLHDKTVISILHRLETALSFDKIMVLEGGEVAHIGTPQEILSQSRLFDSLNVSR